MKDDDQLHPGHHSIRLSNRDYSAPDFYFVTICALQSRCIFGRILNAQMEPSRLGRIVKECWAAIPVHFAHTRLHAFVVMPNHMHGIVEIVRRVGAQHAAPLQEMQTVEDRRCQVHPGSLSAIVRSFKSEVTRRARLELSWLGDVWQRNYFERVLRDSRELADASAYVVENIKNWVIDIENLQRKQNVAASEAGAQQAAPLQRERA